MSQQTDNLQRKKMLTVAALLVIIVLAMIGGGIGFAIAAPHLEFPEDGGMQHNTELTAIFSQLGAL